MLNYIYYPVSGIMWFWHKVFGSSSGRDSGFAWVLGGLPGLHAARDPVQAVHEPDALDAQDAGGPAGDEEAREKYKDDKQRMAEEMQKLQGAGGQPAGLLSAGAHPGAGVHRSVPRAADVPARLVRQNVYFFEVQDVVSMGNAKLGGAPLVGFIDDAAGSAELHGRRPSAIICWWVSR